MKTGTKKLLAFLAILGTSTAPLSPLFFIHGKNKNNNNADDVQLSELLKNTDMGEIEYNVWNDENSLNQLLSKRIVSKNDQLNRSELNIKLDVKNSCATINSTNSKIKGSVQVTFIEQSESKHNNTLALSNLFENTNIDTDIKDNESANLILNRICQANPISTKDIVKKELNAELIKGDNSAYVLIYGGISRYNDAGGIDSYMGSIYLQVNITSSEHDNTFALSDLLTNTNINTKIEGNDTSNLILSRIKDANSSALADNSSMDLKSQLIEGSEVNYVLIYGIVNKPNETGGTDSYVGSIYVEVGVSHSHHNNTLELSTVLTQLNFTDTIEFHDGSQLAFDHLVQKLQSAGYDTSNLKMSGENSTTNTSFTLTGSISKLNSAGGIDTYVANDNVVQFTRSPEAKHQSPIADLNLNLNIGSIAYKNTRNEDNFSKLISKRVLANNSILGSKDNFEISDINKETNTATLKIVKTLNGVNYVGTATVTFAISDESKHQSPITDLNLNLNIGSIAYKNTRNEDNFSKLISKRVLANNSILGSKDNFEISDINKETNTATLKIVKTLNGVNYVGTATVTFAISDESKHQSPITDLNLNLNIGSIAYKNTRNEDNFSKLISKRVLANNSILGSKDNFEISDINKETNTATLKIVKTLNGVNYVGTATVTFAISDESKHQSPIADLNLNLNIGSIAYKNTRNEDNFSKLISKRVLANNSILGSKDNFEISDINKETNTATLKIVKTLNGVNYVGTATVTFAISDESKHQSPIADLNLNLNIGSIAYKNTRNEDNFSKLISKRVLANNSILGSKDNFEISDINKETNTATLKIVKTLNGVNYVGTATVTFAISDESKHQSPITDLNLNLNIGSIAYKNTRNEDNFSKLISKRVLANNSILGSKDNFEISDINKETNTATLKIVKTLNGVNYVGTATVTFAISDESKHQSPITDLNLNLNIGSIAYKNTRNEDNFSKLISKRVLANNSILGSKDNFEISDINKETNTATLKIVKTLNGVNYVGTATVTFAISDESKHQSPITDLNLNLNIGSIAYKNTRNEDNFSKLISKRVLANNSILGSKDNFEISDINKETNTATLKIVKTLNGVNYVGTATVTFAISDESKHQSPIADLNLNLNIGSIAYKNTRNEDNFSKLISKRVLANNSILGSKDNFEISDINKETNTATLKIVKTLNGVNYVGTATVTFAISDESKHNNTLELSTVLTQLNFADTIEFHDGSQLAFDHLVQKLQSAGYDTTNLKMGEKNSTTNTSFTLTGSISKSNSANGIDTYVANNDVVQFTRSPESKHQSPITDLNLNLNIGSIAYKNTRNEDNFSQLISKRVLANNSILGSKDNFEISDINKETNTATLKIVKTLNGVNYVGTATVTFAISDESKHQSPITDLNLNLNIGSIAYKNTRNEDNFSQLISKRVLANNSILGSKDNFEISDINKETNTATLKIVKTLNGVNYVGTATVTFAISDESKHQSPITDLNLNLNIGSIAYKNTRNEDNFSKLISKRVLANNSILGSKDNFEISDINKETNTATLKIVKTLNGVNYVGTATVTFAISDESKHNNTLELSTVLAQLNFTDTIEFHDGSQLAFDHLVQKLQSVGYDTTNLKMGEKNSTTNTSFTLTGSISKSNSANGIDTYVANNDVVQFTRSPESKHQSPVTDLNLNLNIGSIAYKNTRNEDNFSKLISKRVLANNSILGSKDNFEISDINKETNTATLKIVKTLNGVNYVGTATVTFAISDESKHNNTLELSTVLTQLNFTDTIEFHDGSQLAFDHLVQKLQSAGYDTTNLKMSGENSTTNTSFTLTGSISKSNSAGGIDTYVANNDVVQFTRSPESKHQSPLSDLIDVNKMKNLSAISEYDETDINKIWMKYIYQQFDNTYGLDFDNASGLVFEQESNTGNLDGGQKLIVYGSIKVGAITYVATKEQALEFSYTLEGQSVYKSKDGTETSFNALQDLDSLTNGLDYTLETVGYYEKDGVIQASKISKNATGIDNNLKMSNKVTSISGLFANVSDSKFTNITLETSTNFDTSNVTDISNLFANSNFTTIDITKLTTSNVTNMSGLFLNCSKMTNVKYSDNLVTSKVTDISYMFSGASKIANTIKFSGFDTSNVTNMSNVFSKCTEFANSIDISAWVTSNVTDMSSMFEGCSATPRIIFSKQMDTSKVTNMSSMFKGCMHVIFSHFNTDKLLSNWDVSNVTDMSSMFEGCGANTTLDLSGWTLNTNVKYDNFNDKNWKEAFLPPFEQ